VIVTFYSYKGGVGRSMALANVADLLARSGLKVLLVDFDLEAPGLESFFPIAHEQVRGHEGLLDLLLAFKFSMSTAASDSTERGAFRQLDRFVTTVYPAREDGGCIDLMPAGQRASEAQMSRYGEELRRFDWADFYFSWSGELFFEWFRKVAGERYDVVLVDSRTGVTETGGVCTYQLADTVVALCAPNVQNVDGTEAMVRHFLSPAVRAARADRPLNLLVVPARVDQEDAALRSTFQQRFEARFARFQPDELARHGLASWDLQVPYDPRYAFDEQVITDPSRGAERAGLAAAYGRLLAGVALLAPEGSKLTGLRPVGDEESVTPSAAPVLSQYDPTTRFAAADVFISYGRGSEAAAAEIQTRLARVGLRAVMSPDPRVQDATDTRALWELVRGARTGLVLVGPAGDRSPWRDRELQELLDPATRRVVFTALLDGAETDRVPAALAGRPTVDLEHGWPDLVAGLRRAVAEPEPARELSTARNPYRAIAPFREVDQDVFVGRDAEVTALVERVATDGGCAIVGHAGVGKTSLLFAGLIPALRSGALPGSERWPVIVVGLGADPSAALATALAATAGTPDLGPENALDDIDRLLAGLRGRYERVVIVIDRMEDLVLQTEDADREDFLRSFTALCRDGRNVIVPVLAVRADVENSILGIHLDTAWPHVLESLGQDELRAAIEVPARRLGLAVEPGLTDRILSEIGAGPGVLALLQLVLDQLWRDRRDGYLTHAAYERAGGSARILTDYADAAMALLADADRALARRVMLQLARPADTQGLSTGPLDVDLRTPAVRRVVEQLISLRLLATRTPAPTAVRPSRQWMLPWRRKRSTGEGEGLWVELANAAIIRGWPELQPLAEERAARYREMVERLRHRYRRRYRWNRAAANGASLALVAAGAAVGLLPLVPQAGHLTTVLGVAVILVEGVTRVLRPALRASRALWVARHLEREIRLFDARGRGYRGADAEVAFVAAVERILERADAAEEHDETGTSSTPASTREAG
jgi:cellulose biosynthesis protein BcsQ